MNTYKYFPHTDEDIAQMLRHIGVKDTDELYDSLPESVRFRKEYELPEAMSEQELRQHVETLGQKNCQLVCFAGAGIYDHYTPAVVNSILARSEFLTSYTPYQAEISQGTLHYIFEYQSMMCRLTGMDVSNASMYDGPTATAEGVLMAWNAARKPTQMLVSETVDDRVRRVVDTYARFHGITITTVRAHNGVTDRQHLTACLQQGGCAGLVVQMPNKYGIVEDFTGLADAVHEQKGLLVINSVAADMAVLKTPAEWGADIAVGEAQSLGMPMSFGGPALGYMCTTEKLVRKMPGRIVGMTQDNRGQRAFVLTLQAREQHIRRQKATSNICSNQSLMALFATVYLAVMGKEGLREAAEQSYAAAHTLADMLTAHTKPSSTPTETTSGSDSTPTETTSGGDCCLTFSGQPFFNEFCITCRESVDSIMDRGLKAGILPGVKISEHVLMIAVTEKRTLQEMEQLVHLIIDNG